jgi:hypothetical protein
MTDLRPDAVDQPGGEGLLFGKIWPNLMWFCDRRQPPFFVRFCLIWYLSLLAQRFKNSFLILWGGPNQSISISLIAAFTIRLTAPAAS